MNGEDKKNLLFYRELNTLPTILAGGVPTALLTLILGRAPSEDETDLINQGVQAAGSMIAEYGIVASIVVIVLAIVVSRLLGEKGKRSASPEQQERIDHLTDSHSQMAQTMDTLVTENRELRKANGQFKQKYEELSIEKRQLDKILASHMKPQA